MRAAPALIVSFLAIGAATPTRAACRPPADWGQSDTVPLVVVGDLDESAPPAAPRATSDAKELRWARLDGFRRVDWRQGQYGCTWDELAAALEHDAGRPWVLLGLRGASSASAGAASVGSLRFGPASPPDLQAEVKRRRIHASLLTHAAPIIVRAEADERDGPVALAEAVAAYLAFREPGANDVDKARLAKRAASALAAWDRAAGNEPITAALTEQIAALLQFAQRCGRLDALLRMRAAAARVPFSAEARRMVAVAELKVSFEPALDCVEQQLLDALAIDPVNGDSIESLGIYYDLSTHAAGHSDSGAETSAAEGLALIPVEHLPPPPSTTELAVGTGLGSGVTPLLRFELTPFGRDSSGWAFRAGFTLPDEREVDFKTAGTPVGAGLWRRYAGTAEVRGRLWLGGRRQIGSLALVMLEAHAGAIVAATLVKGELFPVTHEEWIAEAGGVAGARLGVRLGLRWLAVWADASLAEWPMARTLHVAHFPGPDPSLPKTEWTATLGLSAFLWR